MHCFWGKEYVKNDLFYTGFLNWVKRSIDDLFSINVLHWNTLNAEQLNFIQPRNCPFGRVHLPYMIMGTPHLNLKKKNYHIYYIVVYDKVYRVKIFIFKFKLRVPMYMMQNYALYKYLTSSMIYRFAYQTPSKEMVPPHCRALWLMT